jgi:hypothetical protein
VIGGGGGCYGCYMHSDVRRGVLSLTLRCGFR